MFPRGIHVCILDLQICGMEETESDCSAWLRVLFRLLELARSDIKAAQIVAGPWPELNIDSAFRNSLETTRQLYLV